MSSKEKYLKYKLKYINLRNNMILMKGGTHTPESLKALITEFITTNLTLPELPLPELNKKFNIKRSSIEILKQSLINTTISLIIADQRSKQINILDTPEMVKNKIKEIINNLIETNLLLPNTPADLLFPTLNLTPAAAQQSIAAAQSSAVTQQQRALASVGKPVVSAGKPVAATGKATAQQQREPASQQQRVVTAPAGKGAFVHLEKASGTNKDRRAEFMARQKAASTISTPLSSNLEIITYLYDIIEPNLIKKDFSLEHYIKTYKISRKNPKKELIDKITMDIITKLTLDGDTFNNLLKELSLFTLYNNIKTHKCTGKCTKDKHNIRGFESEFEAYRSVFQKLHDSMSKIVLDDSERSVHVSIPLIINCENIEEYYILSTSFKDIILENLIQFRDHLVTRDTDGLYTFNSDTKEYILKFLSYIIGVYNLTKKFNMRHLITMDEFIFCVISPTYRSLFNRPHIVVGHVDAPSAGPADWGTSESTGWEPPI